MVVNGCLLDEAYGDSFMKQRKKKKEKKNYEKVEIDSEFNNSSNNIRANIDNDSKSYYYPVNRNYYQDKGFDSQNINQPVVSNVDSPQKDTNYLSEKDNRDLSEYNRAISDKEYNDYLEFQRNRHKYIQKDIIESFSNINDNFNDVLLFGLYGIFFLIFTDYIYKLGKRAY
tara:strand:+ start:1460 stop:1972 length:513 start_codon:yes stop_codon:yes gene_type:complete